MDKKDNENIDNMLRSLRSGDPTDLQIHKWKSSVNYKVEQSRLSYLKPFLQYGVTLSLGVFIGFVLFSGPKNSFDEFAEDDATVEVIYSNLD